jgi:regulator of sigma E protease
MIYSVLSIVALILGFGFVIFVHELGHFLAAKWAGVRVDQFAVGFGHALLAWRKGIGVRIGTTRPEYDSRVREHLAASDVQRSTSDAQLTDDQRFELAAEELDLGETEYRLNWIPLGGYVKMLGQDDLRPGASVEHPKAYNSKSIGKRMVIVSAGVIMNVILAAIGFMIVFLMGFNTPPAQVGSIIPGSPAQQTVRADDGSLSPLQVGDEILTFNDKRQHDFTKISLSVALAREDSPSRMTVKRVDGTIDELLVRPTRYEGAPAGFVSLGIGKPLELRGGDERLQAFPEGIDERQFLPESLSIRPGDTITHLNGEPVDAHTDYYKLDRLIQASQGDPVHLTVQDRDAQVRTELLHPRLQTPAPGVTLSIAGMVPRLLVDHVSEESPLFGQLMPGDVIVELEAAGDRRSDPAFAELSEWLSEAGQQGRPVKLTVLRDGQLLSLDPVVPVRLPGGRFGMRMGLGYYDPTPVVAAITEGGPASNRVPRSARITAVNSQTVETWFDVHRQLRQSTAGATVELAYTAQGGQTGTAELVLSRSDLQELNWIRYGHALTLDASGFVSVLHDRIVPRQTSNPLIAAWWGVTETRDFIIKFYLTLQRMVERTVSYKNLMGPVGIVQAGTHFAWRGTDWLIWFLAMISANLAVVNFLPIPIVDGGLFTFLILEKIKGKPISARTQAIAQVVGMALILSVFLLVTYQDILRLIS